MMTAESMQPLGLAMLDYLHGDTAAEIIIYRDDHQESRMPLSVFFRNAADFPIDKVALDNCRGRVLDVGAGSGLHSLYLQVKGHSVCAMDISPEVCEVMRARGVRDVYCGNIADLKVEPFDTLLILGRSICMVEDIAGLDGFLEIARGLVNPGGQIILNSTDVRWTDDPMHLAYHEKNRRAGRYIGECQITIEYKGKKGPDTGLLHVDPVTLAARADEAGWDCEVLWQDEVAGYLAKLTIRDK